MRNFKLFSGIRIVRDNVYRISHISSAHSYFRTEYSNLPTDLNGTILFATFSDEEQPTSLIDSINERMQEISGNTCIVSQNCAGHDFFISEYKNQFPEDMHHNIIVPIDNYQMTKTRSRNCI